MRRLVWLLLASLLFFPACKGREANGDGPLLVLSYADNQPDDHPATLAAIYFASLVEERTGGRVSIEVYADGELGTELAVFEQMRYGGVDIARLSVGIMTDYFPQLGLIELPFLYKDSSHMWRVLDGELGDYILAETEEQGMFGLAWLDAGARSFYTRTQVSSLEDLKGMRIRILETDLMERFVEPLEVVPVRMNYGDVYSALMKNAIDGAENNLPSYYSMGHYQAARYVYMDEHYRVPELLMMSINARSKLESVDPSLLPVLQECAREAALYERALWQEQEAEVMEKLLASGVVMTYPSEEDRVKARELMTAVYADYGSYSWLISRIRDQ